MTPMPNSNDFLKIETGAHGGAFGINSQPTPTQAQCLAGNYKVGRIRLHGFDISIEQPRGSYRTGIDAKTGKEWSSRMAAHYGYIAGTKGADGDAVDCFVGFYPQAETVFVINQNVHGKFDEHKVVFGCPDEESARRTYSNSYDRGWDGLASIIPVSIAQLKWWLENANMNQPMTQEQLPKGQKAMLERTQWTADAVPETKTLDQLLYDIRRSDHGENLMLDSVTLADIMEDSDGVLAFDALVTPFAKLGSKMNVLKNIMDRTGQAVNPVSFQITDPFTQRGVANVVALFELSDGQTVSIYFHNPDVTPKKMMGDDEVISWKWLLNKKDITIVVAPERGTDLNIREVARRIMKLAEKNSPAFQRVNAKKAETMQRLGALKEEIASLEVEFKTVQHELEIAKVEADDRFAKASAEADAARARADILARQKADRAAELAARVAIYDIGKTNPQTGRWNKDGGTLIVSKADGDLYKWVVEDAVQRTITNTVDAAFDWLGSVLMGMGESELRREQVLERLMFKEGTDLLGQAEPAKEPSKFYVQKFDDRFRVTSIKNGNPNSPSYPTEAEAEAAMALYPDYPAPSDAIADISYIQDGMFTTFIPNTKAGESVWREMAVQDDGTGKVLNAHAADVIRQIRGKGYTVEAAVKSTMTAAEKDALSAELSAPVPAVKTPDPVAQAANTKESLIEAYKAAWQTEADKVNALVASVNWAGIVDSQSGEAEQNRIYSEYRQIKDIKEARKAFEDAGFTNWNDLPDSSDVPGYHAQSDAQEAFRAVSDKIREAIKSAIKKQGAAEFAALPPGAPIEDLAQAVYHKHGYDADLRADYFGRIVQAIKDKNGDFLQGIFGGVGSNNNKASMEVFERATGLTLANTQKARALQIDAWAGITPEARAQIEADKDAAYAAKEAAQAVRDAWDWMGRVKIVDGSTGQGYLLDLVSEGKTEIHTLKKGAVPVYGLGAPGDSSASYLKSKSFTAFMKAANKFGGLMQALDLVGAVIPEKKEPVDNTLQIKDVNGVDVSVDKVLYAMANAPTSALIPVDLGQIDAKRFPGGDFYAIELSVLRDGSFLIYRADGSVVVEKSKTGQGDLGGNADALRISYATPKSMTEDQFKLAKYKQLRLDLDSGIRKPAQIIGGGHKNARKDAEKWIDDRIAEYEGKMSAGAPIELTGKELGDFPDTEQGKIALRQAARVHLEGRRGTWVKCPAMPKDEAGNVREIEIRQRGIDEFIRFSANPDKLRMASAIETIIETAKNAEIEPNFKSEKKSSSLAYYRLSNSVAIAGRPINVTVLVEQDVNGYLHYDIMIPAQKTKATLDSSGAAFAPTSNPATKAGVVGCLKFAAFDQICQEDELECDENVNDTNDFDESEIGEVFEPEYLTLDSATGSQMVFNLFIEGEEPEVVEFEDDQGVDQEVKAPESAPAPVAPEPSPPTAPVPPAETHDSLIAGIKTHYVAIRPFAESEVPADWLVMNAPRPLLGTKTIDNGEFLTGRYYAAIDPSDYMAAAYVKENIKLAAEMVLYAEMPVQIEMALEGAGEYRAAYEAMPTEKRTNAVKPLINRIQGKPYAEAKAFLNAARSRVGQAEQSAPAQSPIDEAKWKILKQDILGSLAEIAAIDQGKSFMDRALFVSSIAGKIGCSNDRGETALAGTALAFVERAQQSMPKPAFAPSNKIWTEVDWMPFAAQFEPVKKGDIPAAPAQTPVAPVSPPVTPTEDPQMTSDKALFQSVIDNTVPDILDMALGDQLEAAYYRHVGNAEMEALFEAAVNAYTEAELAASANL